MSSGFIFGVSPLKPMTPVMLPAVAASTEMVAALGGAAGCSETGCGLVHPSATEARAGEKA